MTERRQTPADRRRATIDTRRLAAEAEREVLAQRLQAIDADLVVAQQCRVPETRVAVLHDERDRVVADQQAAERYLHNTHESRDPESAGRRASDYEPEVPRPPDPLLLSAYVRCAQCGRWLHRKAGVPITVGPDGVYRLWTPERAAHLERVGRAPVLASLCLACAAAGFSAGITEET